MNPMKLLPCVLLTVASAAHADYDCKIAITEKVPVVTIDYKSDPKIKLANGVPAELILSRKDLNPEFFTQFSDLTYSGHGDGKTSTVTYYKKIENDSLVTVIEQCFHPETYHSCAYIIDTHMGQAPFPIGLVTYLSKDKNLMAGQLAASYATRVKDQEFDFTVSLNKMGFKGAINDDHHIETQASVTIPIKKNQPNSAFELAGGKDDMEVMGSVSCSRK